MPRPTRIFGTFFFRSVLINGVRLKGQAKNIDMDFSTVYVNCSWVGQKILQALQVLMNLLTSMPMWLQVVVFVYLYLIGFSAYVKLHGAVFI